MNNITVDFSKSTGKMKIMHSVNNGPAGSDVRGTSNAKYFKEAKIPYARTHDASFYAGYGGEHTVDIHAIFKNFDADVNDPKYYDFEMTDMYLKRIQGIGCETFYRLGSKIEHEKKFGTYPPKDNQKWAEICEHIIRHYNEGWAEGFHYGIKYWEIWNEPDCLNPDESTPCWQGTQEQFVELFITVLKHLKKCFPNLKIGGPALCSSWNESWNGAIFGALQKENMTMDFFSFHCYAKEPYSFYKSGEQAYSVLKRYGCEGKTELILNEWNYIRGWLGEEIVYSYKAIAGLKGSSFIAGTMCEGQKSKLDQMMYYDARPCTFNGMFDIYMQPLKGYYPFKIYGELYGMGECVFSESDEKGLYNVAAKGENCCGVMFTHYDENDETEVKQVELTLNNLPEGRQKIEYFLISEDKDLETVWCETVETKELSVTLNVPLHNTYYIRITKL